VLAHGWYYDESLARITRGPGTEAFELTRRFDSRVIDGAVNGVGGLVKIAGGRLRLLQTGYVRNYALGIAIGALALVAFLMTRIGL
jgi:NADH-quinone oxidoreductase subunit L